MTKTKKFLQENMLNNSTIPKYKTQDNANVFPKTFEKIDPVSETIPNETYSLREIVEKFSREYPKHLLRMGYSDDINEENPDFDDIDITRQPDFDLIDAKELSENIKNKYKKLQIKEIKPIEKQEVKESPNDI